MNQLILSQEMLDSGISKICQAIENHTEDRFNKKMKIRFAYSNSRENLIAVRFPVQDWQLNQNGTLHGGAMAAGFDMAMGIFSNFIAYLHGNVAVTTHLNVRFLKSVPADETVLVTARAELSENQLISLTGEAWLESSQNLVATADAAFMLITPPAGTRSLNEHIG
ncbi:MAG TPA: PaaI family thioesterase [Clostridiales bacterium]|jgi:uncharacterized protein (TIGR00369 family)|nr:PaaI family thioesterase [Clostridiales bacterium]